MNPLIELSEHGQSYWLDNLTRDMIEGGALKRRVEEEDLRGVTSNPAIFNKAIAGSDRYRERITDLARRGLTTEAIYEELVTTDVRDACDLLRPVWERTGGVDGYVSLEVSPRLADDAEGTIREARHLHARVARPNLMIKVPATEAGLRAEEELLYEGINVNVTLLFAVGRYAEVAETYITALEKRLASGARVDDVASVASLFLSRIDTLVDKQLAEITDADRAAEARDLAGRAAVANAKLAYARFALLFSGERWERLAAHGARVQRPLWASTSTKNAAYRDVMYVEPLIGPHTVNTLPEATIDQFRDHGQVAVTVGEGMEAAQGVMNGLAELGIDMGEVTDTLLVQGIRLFVEPFDALLATIAGIREAAGSKPAP